MKLYLISQTANHDYDSFDSAVVAAENEANAREIHPSENSELEWLHNNETGSFAWGRRRPNGIDFPYDSGDWVVPAKVTVELIGNAKPGTLPGVICSSFNAG